MMMKRDESARARSALLERIRSLGPFPDFMVIGGERTKIAMSRLDIEDPGSGLSLTSVPAGSADDIDRAVAAAKRAQIEWGRALPAQRGRILYKAAALIRREASRLAVVETLDSGKPLRESQADVETAARYFEYYAGAADKIQGQTIPLGFDFISWVVREPAGVTAHIVPWNFPLTQVARSVAPALAAGNSAVVKPAEETPISALLLAEILNEAGLPDGLYNVVTGLGGVAGVALSAHDGIDHLTFTGSVPTGQEVMRAAASHLVPLTLELGGKSPILVLRDADLQSAINGVLKGIFTHAGQVCSAGSRLVVERAVHDEVIEALAARAGKFSLGHGLSDPPLGPLASARQAQRVCQFVEDAQRRGLAPIVGGKRVQLDQHEEGHYFEATIFDSVPATDPLCTQEIFGPVLCVQVAEDLEHALTLANGTEYGLVAGIYTSDISRALSAARELRAGQVSINGYGAGGVETPFGGLRMSGFGREKGLAALDSYTRIKTVTARIS